MAQLSHTVALLQAMQSSSRDSFIFSVPARVVLTLISKLSNHFE